MLVWFVFEPKRSFFSLSCIAAVLHTDWRGCLSPVRQFANAFKVKIISNSPSDRDRSVVTDDSVCPPSSFDTLLLRLPHVYPSPRIS